MTLPERTWHLLVPGPLSQRTGGFVYDAEVVGHARAAGHAVTVHELEGPFPGPDSRCAEALTAALEQIPPGTPVVLDGLAAGAHPDVLHRFAATHRLIALIHHPLGDETGLSAEAARVAHARELDGLTAVHGVLTSSAFTIRRLRALAFEHGTHLPPLRAAEPGVQPPADAVAPADRPRTPAAEPCLLCIATLTPRKGQAVLVDALARITDLPWRCELIGSTERDAAYAAHVRRAIEAAGLRERVQLRGEVDDDALQDAWARADVFVLPSLYEGYGMVLADARARGVPIVTTTGGAIPDTVAGSPAEQVPPGDADALATRLRARLHPPEALHAWQAEARDDASTLPSWAACARAFLDALQELVQCPRRSTLTG